MDKNNQQQRFHFIELIAYWEGWINTSHLIQQFGLSRPQCSADINAYNRLTSGNLMYNKSVKAHFPSETFNCCFISADVEEYLTWLQNPAQLGSVKLETQSLPNISLSLPPRKVSPLVMRALTTAIKKQLRVNVDYASLNNPKRDGRIIAPHTFINTGLRWHLRAWCEKSRGYRDFVLSRFRGEPALKEKSEHTAEQDTAWNTFVTVIVQPDPRLSLEKREVLENDYQMQNGQLPISTRACLVHYLLREMQINTKMLDGTPEAQQLVCVNLPDIKQWLFEG